MKTLAALILLLTVTLVAAADGTFVTRVIHESDGPYQINLSGRQWIKITNFVQQGGDVFASVAVYQGASGLPGVTLLNASNPETTHTAHDEVFVSGPTIVYVAPVSGATVIITYLRGSNN